MSGDALVLGLGYTGRAFARALVARGLRVRATTRDPAACPPEAGVELLALGPGRPLAAGALEGAGGGPLDALLSTVPPDEAGDPVLADLAPALRARPPRWVGYLSSTGVYGDHGGAWVEARTAATRPTSARARRRLEAEGAWRALLPGVPVHVFRLAGIYGPGRSALDEVRAGRARRVLKPGHVVSRCHVDDIVAVLLASLDRPDPGAIYDVADDDPRPSADVVAWACELLGAPPAPAVAWDDPSVSPMLRSFFVDHKRVANARIKAELGVVLRHPDARAGLRAILAAEAAAGHQGSASPSKS